jgi:hypothetical protein
VIIDLEFLAHEIDHLQGFLLTQCRFRLEAAPGPKTPAVRIECVGGRLERSSDMRTRRFLELR